MLIATLVASSACDGAPEATRESSAGAVGSAAKRKPELVKIETTSTGRDSVKAEIARAERDGQKVVIYVGATWCEPCQRFKDALASGKLDADLANVRFVELDHDAHEALLSDADTKCESKLIPLFARPEADGTCGPRRVEGAIKGEGAVGYLLPKLQAILASE